MTNMNKRSKRVINIALIAIFGALSFVCTAFFPIPIAGGQGYLNFSDAFVFLISALISPLVGGFVGSLSGSMADLYAGYGSFAPYTAVIKLVEGIIAGYLFMFLRARLIERPKAKYLSFVSFYIAGIVMAFSYMIPDLVMYGASVAWIDLPFNLIQGVLNATIAIVAFLPLSNNQVFDRASLK